MNKRTNLSLETVKQRFQIWRVRKTKGSKIPDSLWVLVKQLVEKSGYKHSMVGRELGISTAQLRKHFPHFYAIGQSHNGENKYEATAQQTFVSAPLTTALLEAPLPTLTLEKADGLKLSLLSPTQEQFSSLVKSFLE